MRVYSMGEAREHFELEIKDIPETIRKEEEFKQKQLEKLAEQDGGRRYDGLSFATPIEEIFTTYKIFPTASNDVYGEMVIDPESRNRFKIRPPGTSWKAYDIGFRELGRVKKCVHEMYRTSETRRRLDCCDIEASKKTCIIILSQAPLDERLLNFVSLRHILVKHNRPRFIPKTDKLSYGVLIRSQYRNADGLWLKLTKHETTPWTKGSRKRARQYSEGFIAKRDKEELENSENGQLELI